MTTGPSSAAESLLAPFMTTIASDELIAEPDCVTRSGSPERRDRVLRQLTGLSLSNADQLDRQQLDVFGAVFVRLIERVEPDKLARPEPQEAIEAAQRKQPCESASPSVAQRTIRFGLAFAKPDLQDDGFSTARAF